MINVTKEAGMHIQAAIQKRGSGIGIRLGVKTTGCSGLAYVLEYVDVAGADDVRIKLDGFDVYVDPKSYVYLDGMTVDYEKSLLQEGLKFINPNEVARCGCGDSFSV
ncbi:MAG: iron-sulfur cluster assembly accessory protein [Hafnia sp.]